MAIKIIHTITAHCFFFCGIDGDDYNNYGDIKAIFIFKFKL